MSSNFSNENHSPFTLSFCRVLSNLTDEYSRKNLIKVRVPLFYQSYPLGSETKIRTFFVGGWGGAFLTV